LCSSLNIEIVVKLEIIKYKEGACSWHEEKKKLKQNFTQKTTGEEATT
jgi:hypothetical protein